MGCHFLLQRIFLTQRSNLSLLCLLHCRWLSLPAETSGSPKPVYFRDLQVKWVNTLLCFVFPIRSTGAGMISDVPNTTLPLTARPAHPHLLSLSTQNCPTPPHKTCLQCRSSQPFHGLLGNLLTYVHAFRQVLLWCPLIYNKNDQNLLWKEIRTSVLVSSGCDNEIPNLGGLNKRNLFLTVLEAEKSKIKRLADSVPWWGGVSWLADSHRLTVSSRRGLRERARTVFFLFIICCCSVTKSCATLCGPMDCSTSGLPVFHCLPQFSQTHVHWVSDAIQPSHPLSPPSSPALALPQHHGLFQWVSSLHQVAKVLEL